MERHSGPFQSMDNGGGCPPGSEQHAASQTSPNPDQEVLVGPRRGRCKWFNVVKGWGFITPDDGGQEVFVHQSVIQMGGFRSLGENEEVEFESKLSAKGYEATSVYGPSHAECKGSDFRPYSKKRRFRKVRCYNCGEFANHIASKCELGPLPKRCHNCRSEDHLIADCPTKPPPAPPQSSSPK
ncbi:AGAP006591-PA [Anopheles gambiae str. PEST]|uniref:AGAP006591-PA n=2 Tax=gambiae species complex TaxID=44542 RepID=Q7Q583_ANOGA|nr:protein lin-28 homolog [Anopheles coluzzii]XP_316618.3 protein lin-28 homolog isoform X1 [Anopheles gambiae]EAA11383.3 AGAP006591-PA [Anopheles gambiae str. PEST]